MIDDALRALEIPEHKKNDAEFLRASCSIAKNFLEGYKAAKERKREYIITLNHIERVGDCYEAMPGSRIGQCIDELRTILNGLPDGKRAFLIHNGTIYEPKRMLEAEESPLETQLNQPQEDELYEKIF